MNTHDKIELPPLPPVDRYFEFDSHRMKASIDIPYWGEKSLEAYALAAIEADRKNTAELLKNPVHVHTNMCRGIIAPITFDQLAHVLGDEATEAWLADRRHSGEPVVMRYRDKDKPNNWSGYCHYDADAHKNLLDTGYVVQVLYSTPQPAEPVGEVLGETCIDGGKCHHGCKERCFRRQCCEPFSDYSGPWEYAAETIYPQPVESMKTLIDNQEPLGEEFQRVLDEHSWDLYAKAAEPHQPLSKSVAKRLAIQLEGRDEPVKSSLKVSYDAHGDCLYVVCDSNEPADAEEDDKGILYRRAISDGRLVGITIMNFMGRHAGSSDDAPQPTEPVKVPSDGERAAQGLPPYNPRKPTEEEWNRLTENGRKAWGKNETEPVNVPLDQAGAVGHAFSLVRRLKNGEPVEDELRQVIRQIAAEAVNTPHATVYCQHPHCQTTGGCQGPCSR